MNMKILSIAAIVLFIGSGVWMLLNEHPSGFFVLPGMVGVAIIFGAAGLAVAVVAGLIATGICKIFEKAFD